MQLTESPEVVGPSRVICAYVPTPKYPIFYSTLFQFQPISTQPHLPTHSQFPTTFFFFSLYLSLSKNFISFSFHVCNLNGFIAGAVQLSHVNTGVNQSGTLLIQ